MTLSALLFIFTPTDNWRLIQKYESMEQCSVVEQRLNADFKFQHREYIEALCVELPKEDGDDGRT